MTFQQILEAALKLERADRELLVEELTASLHGGFASKEIEQAWIEEIQRRADEIDAGKAEYVEGSVVQAEIAKRLGEK